MRPCQLNQKMSSPHSIILEVVATEVASQTRHSQDALIVQGKFLIGNTLQMYVVTTVYCFRRRWFLILKVLR